MATYAPISHAIDTRPVSPANRAAKNMSVNDAAVIRIPISIFITVDGSAFRRRSQLQSDTSSGVNTMMQIGSTDWNVSGAIVVAVLSRAQNVSV